MKITADELRFVRAHMDLTQAEMAQHLGISARTIVNWETNGVPDSKVARVHAVLRDEIAEAKEVQRWQEELAEMPMPEPPSDDDKSGWLAAEHAEMEARPGKSPDQRRSYLLQAFTDSDLLSELRTRALRRGDRTSTWDAARFERYQQFVAPKWEDPDYSQMSEHDAYDLAASRGEENIGHDELPHEP
ncbi:helix-turn-helix domain-containing protein [Arthrobacter sp. D3-18]